MFAFFRRILCAAGWHTWPYWTPWETRHRRHGDTRVRTRRCADCEAVQGQERGEGFDAFSEALSQHFGHE
jgi:hypothetical protein